MQTERASSGRWNMSRRQRVTHPLPLSLDELWRLLQHHTVLPIACALVWGVVNAIGQRTPR